LKQFATSDNRTTTTKSSTRSYYESNFYNQVFAKELIMLST